MVVAEERAKAVRVVVAEERAKVARVVARVVVAEEWSVDQLDFCGGDVASGQWITRFLWR